MVSFWGGYITTRNLSSELPGVSALRDFISELEFTKLWFSVLNAGSGEAWRPLAACR